MFVVLDTNHLREFVTASPLGKRLKEQIFDCKAEGFTCIVVVEEAMQGWLSLLHRAEPGPHQVGIYQRMQSTLVAAMQLGMLPFDQEAAEVFVELRHLLRRTGSMDLKIAATCLAHDFTLLTRNTGDFQNIPGLRVENWLD